MNATVTPKLPVLFRKMPGRQYEDDGVTAVFPTEAWSPCTVACYAHIGQHGACDRGWYNRTREAKPEEYAELLAELRSIYETGPDPVELVVRRRWAAHYDTVRRAKW